MGKITIFSTGPKKKIDRSLRTLMLLHSPRDAKPFCVVQPNGDNEHYNRDGIKALGPEYDEAAKEAVLSGYGTYFLRAK